MPDDMAPMLFDVEGPSMKWFRLDSDAPVDPKFAMLLSDGFTSEDGATAAHAAFGAALLIACYVADHGRGDPGYGVDKAGAPLDLEEMAFAARFDGAPALIGFLDVLARRRLINPELWSESRVVCFPAMVTRADEYTQRKLKGSKSVGRTSETLGMSPDTVEKCSPTKQDKTVQDKTSGAAAAPVADLMKLFDDLHLAKLGSRAVFSRPKDPTLLARLWRERKGQTPDAEALIRAFFASDDEFVYRAGYTVGVLSGQAGKLVASLAKRPAPAARGAVRRGGVSAGKADKYAGVQGGGVQ